MTEPGKPWFERSPGLLDWELKRFEEWGIDVKVDPEERQRGRLVIHCEERMNAEPVPIEIRYPSEYPELPPLIIGPAGLMDRHQHRFAGNFCLLARPLDDWPAGTWGAADLVGERLRALIGDTEAGDEAVRAAEEPMPEPVSAYYQTASDATVLMPDLLEPAGESGELVVRRCTHSLFVTVGRDGEILDDEMSALFPGDQEFVVPWVRILEAPPVGPDAAAVAQWVRKEHPHLLARDLPRKLRDSKHLASPPPIEFCCLVFPEEGPEVGEFHDGYLLLYVERDGTGNRREALLGTQRLSLTERARRAPELAGLDHRQALVIGLGTLGGDIAVELAKAGLGHLELLDYDSLEFGNLLRHRLGLEYLGMPKARGVALAVRRANPFTATSIRELRLGSVDWADESPLAELAAAIGNADVVIDASGSHQIAQLVGRICTECDTPMIATWLTEGFWGAEVVRIIPGKTMCWTCFATAQQEGTLLRAESGPATQVAALGCSHLTTAGAGFDATETAAVATRLVVQTLEPEGGYAPCEWDHAVLNFRRSPWDSTVPRVGAETLPPREECELCMASAGSAVTR